MDETAMVSRTDLARRLCVQVHQIDYLVRTGRIPAGAKGEKFRSYTEEQAQGIENWFQAYKRLDAGYCGLDTGTPSGTPGRC